MTLHQKFYALVAIYQPTNQPHHYEAFFQYQWVDVVQGADVARVVFSIQLQAHSKMKKTLHPSQPSQLYITFPIRLEYSSIRERQLIPKDCNQNAKPYLKRSQATPNKTKCTPDEWRKSLQNHNQASIPVLARWQTTGQHWSLQPYLTQAKHQAI